MKPDAETTRTAELCFNLWYYLTQRQTITGLAARAYLIEGTEDEKGQLLLSLSCHDYKTIPVTPVPNRLLRLSPGGLHYSALTAFGAEEVFNDVLQSIYRSLPSGVPIPDDKLFHITPLFDFGFGDGYVPVTIGNGFIVSRR